MKLVIAVVQGADADRLLSALSDGGFHATQIVSAGGFLRESNITVLAGVDDGEVERFATLVRTNSQARQRFVNPLMPMAEVRLPQDQPNEVTVGGATIFVLRVSRFERLVPLTSQEA